MKLIGFLLLVVMTFLGCTPSEPHRPFIDRIQEQSQPVAPQISSSPYHADLKKVEVMGKPGTFTVDRTHLNTKKDCRECHRDQKVFNPKARKSHWDVKLYHAGPAVMDCRTCHLKNSADQLVLMKGQRVDYAHSYQVCAQCHSSQHRDWLGGAHGKRLGGWAPPRVIQTCVGCHNPHRPAWDKRIPKRDQTIKERLKQ